MTLSTTGDGLTVTLPAMTGTVELLIYSRGNFVYNNNTVKRLKHVETCPQINYQTSAKISMSLDS